MGFRLTPRADEDVRQIHRRGRREFGRRQADEYSEGLYRVFVRLAQYPELGRLYDDIRPPIRLWWHRPHHVIYRLDGENVVIVRVIHASRDWPRHLPAAGH
jgi:toxin ParE1/3/4